MLITILHHLILIQNKNKRQLNKMTRENNSYLTHITNN